MKPTQFLTFASVMGIGIRAMTKTSDGKVRYHFDRPEKYFFQDESYNWRSNGRGLHDPKIIISFPDGIDGAYRANNGRLYWSYIGRDGWFPDMGDVEPNEKNYIYLQHSNKIVDISDKP